MAFSIKNNIKVGIAKETIEGSFEAISAGGQYLQILADGLEMTPSRELLERNVLGTGLGKIAPRTGLKSVSGSLPVYLKAGSTATALPEVDVLLHSLLGAKRSSASVVSGTAHTASVINVSSTSNLKVGDVVVVKAAGSYHKSPIQSLVADTSITLKIPMAAAPSDAVIVEAFTTYYAADSGHPSFSVSKYVEDNLLEKAVGCKSTNMSLESFETGKIASLKFGFEGLDFDREISPVAVAPSFSTSETPIILDAYIYQNGNKISVNNFSLSVENKLGFIQDTENGKKSSRVTERSIKGSINPYKDSNSLDNFNKFNGNQPFSLFVTCHNPTAINGEYKESISFYMPNCLITELNEADQDGVLQENISFSANTDQDGMAELFVSFS